MKKALVLFVLASGIFCIASASADPSLGEAGEVQTYLVQPGDRLERVAARYGLTGEELLAANPRSAYGIKCGNPQRVTRQNGTTRFICGGDLPYLIAGKTLIVPEPQILIQARNTELQTELVMLRAEMENLKKEIETGKSALAEARQERDDLVSERDDLRDENTNLVAAKAELEGKYSGVDLANQRIILSGRRGAESSSDNTTALLAVLGFAVVVLFIFAFYYSPNRKTKRLAMEARRDREHVAVEQKALVRDRAEVAKKRQEVEEKQRKLDDERTAHALELQAREVERAAFLVDRKAVDETRRVNEKLKADLEECDASLKKAADELDQRDQELRRRNGELNGREVGLYLGEENFAASQKLLEGARHALRQDREAHHKEVRRLAELRGRVEAGLRTLEEDGPALTRDRQAVQTQVEQITQRIGTIVAREIDVKGREDRVAAREKAAQSREEEVSRREDQAAVLAERERAVREAEEKSARAEDDLRKKQEEFGRFMQKSRQELVDRGRDLDDREARQAERAQASASGTDDEEETRELPPPLPDEGSITHLDAPGSEPVMSVSTALCPDCGHEVPLGKLDEHRVVAHGVGAREASINPPAQTASGGQETCVREGGGEVALTSAEAHLGVCRPPEGGTADLHDTDLEIPMAAKPSREESGIYCTACNELYSAGEYARDHAGHNVGLPKP